MRFLFTSKSEKADSIIGLIFIKSPLRFLRKYFLHSCPNAVFTTLYRRSNKWLRCLVFCAKLAPQRFVPVRHSVFIFAVKFHAPNCVPSPIDNGFRALYRLCHTTGSNVLLRSILNRLLHNFLPSFYHIQRQVFIIQALRKNLS